MLMASYFLNKVTCTNIVVIFWKLTEGICIFKNFAVSCHFIKYFLFLHLTPLRENESTTM